jgi:hypothetical protein
MVSHRATGLVTQAECRGCGMRKHARILDSGELDDEDAVLAVGNELARDRYREARLTDSPEPLNVTRR